MKPFLLSALIAFLLLVGLSGHSNASSQQATQSPADHVLTNGRIYTVDDDNPCAEALAVRRNEIVYVGNGDGAKAFIGDATKVEDLGGKFVMPGMIATHEHSIFYMITSSGLNIKELSHDKDKMLAEVKKYLEQNPDGPYYSFGGAYEKSVTIRREEIDAITGPDREKE